MRIKFHKSGPSRSARSAASGFSLIEMLVYIAVLTLMLGIIVEVVLTIAKHDRVIKSLRTIENSAISALERIGREVRQSESLSAAGTTLTLTRDATTVEFYLSGTELRMREGGVEQGALTDSGARVSALQFTRFFSASGEGVRTEMTIETGTSTYYRTETFYSSALIR